MFKHWMRFAVVAIVALTWSGVASLAKAEEVGGSKGTGVKMLFDFEDGKADAFEGGKVTTENALHGKYSLLADKDAVRYTKNQDWSGYDLLKIDVLNPGAQPVMLLVELRDAETKDYWTRVNYNTVIPPGKSTVTLPTDIYVGEKSRPGRSLIKEKVRFIALAPSKFPLLFDDIRLEKLETSKVAFEGLRAFDFGPGKSPVMTGYKGVDVDAKYSKQRGYGWIKAAGGLTAFDGMQPDALFQDYVTTVDAGFQVDLPNGKYHVIMNIDSPGGYWGEVQQYGSREVKANGKVVVEEKMTIEEFKKQYFHNAHREDLPGVDTFKEYVEPMFHVKQFDVEVTDGQAIFEMRGNGRWPIALSAMVIYPTEKGLAGEKFWQWTTEQRKTQFENYFKQVIPPATGAKAPAEGYAVFSRSFMTPPNAFDGPREGEGIPAEGLAVTVARGEEGAVTFSVQPSGDLGTTDVGISDLQFGGATSGEVIPMKARAVQAGWLDYRISRATMEGTVYKVAPRYWHPVPAPDAPKVTRTFWLRVKVPMDVTAGPYLGMITIKPQHGAVRTIPLKLTVLPFALNEIKDVAAGPWGGSITLPWEGSDPKRGQWEREMLEKSMDAIREAGCTTMTGLPHIGVKAAHGKVVLDFSRADGEMKLLRAHGFDRMINSYGTELGYPMKGTAAGADDEFAKRAGFADMHAFLKSLYGQIEEHAKENNWLPVAWNICDEPLGDAAKGAARNAAVHEQVAQELGLKYNVFTGATSMEGNDATNVHYDLVRALGMPSLNLHDEASIKVIHDGGHVFSFYNGGNRWTYGRYMKALVVRYGLAYRTSWHFNVVAGDPYYALDCREDDYCWYNTDASGAMIPNISLLGEILPGLNDYRYLSTLERLVKEKGDAAGAAKKVYEEQIDLVAGKNRKMPSTAALERDREAVIKAILSLTEGK